MVDGMYVMERLALPPGATVYVTARVMNTVGLYVIMTSEAVVISPEPRLEVTLVLRFFSAVIAWFVNLSK